MAQCWVLTIFHLRHIYHMEKYNKWSLYMSTTRSNIFKYHINFMFVFLFCVTLDHEIAVLVWFYKDLFTTLKILCWRILEVKIDLWSLMWQSHTLSHIFHTFYARFFRLYGFWQQILWIEIFDHYFRKQHSSMIAKFKNVLIGLFFCVRNKST